jgi:N-acetylglucosamine-6-phosphate deacetylase
VPSLTAARAVTPVGVTGPVQIVIEGDRIAEVRPAAPPVDTDTTIVPGYVDLQVNGIDDVDVAHADGDDWGRIETQLLAEGVTTWCPTLVTMPLGAYPAPLARVAARAGLDDGDPRPGIAGVHLEGPFLGAAMGAHPPDLVRPLDRRWLAALPPIVRVVTLGAELEGIEGAVAELAGRGVLVSVGHTAADHEAVGRAVDAGARLVTHVFNGMPPLHHRRPGPVGAALTDDRVAVSLIADLVHVHPLAIQLAFRAKPAERIVLVTDAVAWRAGTAGTVRLDLLEGAPRLPDGTLAGSVLRMDQAVANVVHAAGVPLERAVWAASRNPAALLGLPDRGRIEVGARADLVLLDGDLQATTTWVGGREAWAESR